MTQFYTFKPGLAEPVNGFSVELFAQLTKALTRKHPGMTVNQLPFAIAACAGESVTPPARGIKRGLICFALLERGTKAMLHLGFGGTLGVGLTPSGQFRYKVDDEADIRESVPAPPLDEAYHWLTTGERGRSSEAMCKQFYGLPVDADTSHPHDPDDFRRCHLFFSDCPLARARLAELAVLSKTWKIYVEHWTEMERLFEEERGQRHAPKLYALMQTLQGQAEALEVQHA